MSGAFARTAIRKAEIRPYAADKIKWWAKMKRANNGEITRHISNFEQKPIGPWLKTFPKKTIDRAPTYIMWPGGCAVLTYATIAYAAGTQAAEDHSHRF